PYTVEDWLEDIVLASQNNLPVESLSSASDGFVLNVGREPWQKDRSADCFHALSQANLPFKLFFSFDMSSIPGQSAGDVPLLCEYMRSFGNHPGIFRYKGGVVISTFTGEHLRFGQQTLDNAWGYVKNALEEIVPIYFIPSFFVDPATYPTITCLDGAFNWNGSWPLHLTSRSPRSEVECPELKSDQRHLRHLGGRTFMAAVSPWFFTHYGTDSWNKNWIYRGDDWLFVRRWEQLISTREQIDIVQVISWNDYGESHYIGPIKGAQPNSQAWVDGFPHTAWLTLNAYYSQAFKEGRYPPIERDQVFLWARPHPKDATAPNDSVGRPTHWQVTDDTLWVVVFSTAAAKVKLYAGDDHKKSFHVKAGVTKLCRSLKGDRGIKVIMERKGAVVAHCAPHGFRFQTRPEVYNFNAFVDASC
ncbi:glycoside hydrolase family 71 protein, partial [Desarmillaria tabescens]